jgi:hypothetical protein
MEDILHNILICLPFSDIIICSNINKLFYKICWSQLLWEIC